MERNENKSKEELINEAEQLKSNEMLYHEIFDRTSDAVYILNKRLEFLKVNSGAVKMYGYSEQELIGKTPEFVSAPGKNNMKQVKKNTLKALKNKPGQFEFWGLRKNGEIFPKSVRVQKGYYQGKSVIFAFGTDITEQKRTEEKLKESETNLNTLIQNRSESIWSLDENLNFVIFNDSFAEYYLKTYKTVLKKGLNALDILNDDLRTFWEPMYKSVLAGNKRVFEFQAEINHKTEIFEVRLNPIKSDKRVTGLSAISKNITTEKQTEEKLIQQEDQFRTITESAGDALFVSDFETEQIIFVNKQACNALGYSQKELLKLKVSDLDPLFIPEKHKDKLWEKMEHGKTIIIEAHHQRKDGSIFPVEIRTGLINFQGKKAVLGFARDISERKQNEKLIKAQNIELKSAKEKAEALKIKFETLSNATFEGIIIHNNGVPVSMNKSLLETSGYTEDELAEKELIKFFIKKEYHNLVYKNIQNNYQQPYEVVAVRKDGTEVPIEIESKTLFKKDNQNLRVSAIRDITERKKKDEELRNSVEKWKTTFDAMHDSVSIIDTDSNILEYNASTLSMFGITKEEIKTKKCFQLVHNCSKPVENCPVEKMKISLRTESMIFQEGERYFEVLVYPVLSPEGELKNAVHVVRDISERKKAEEKLKASEYRNRILFDYAPIPIWEEDFSAVKKEFERLKGEGIKNFETYFNKYPDEVKRFSSLVKIIAVNQKSSEFYKTESIRQLASQLSEWFKDESYDVFKQELIALSEGKTVFDSEIKIQTLKKETKYLHLSLNIPPSSHNSFERVFVSFLDITNRKKAENKLEKYQNHLEELVKERTQETEEKTQKLKEAQQAMRFLLEDINETAIRLENTNNKLTESNKDLESFAYTVSHDLKTPLRAITGYTNVLVEDFEKDFSVESKEFLNLIIKNSKKMNMLIDDLLKFAKSGKQIPDRSKFNLSVLVQDVFNDLKQNYSNKKIEFKLEKDVFINADIGSMKQVIFNLLNNALKFSKQNEHVKIEFGSTEYEDQNWFFIKDNGIGFNMEYHEKIFSVFKRLHSADKYEGTGIGLALVKRILEKHGGDIRAESELGKGSIFYFKVN